ncbi:MAG: Tat pathway signal protein [Armatimonadota bacterium]|nr:Tat pathway signal protein [Armatimonadota bacterium]
MIWAYLLHLGYNMWLDREAPELGRPDISSKPYLRFDENLWNDLLQHMARSGVNMLVMDLGEGVRYASHPELAVEGAWPPEKLRSELAKVRQLGIEPIPKLNFSATHDAWLGTYSRMVSTPTYYSVCRDLIGEVIELFDGPRFFHLGMDEETAEHQRHHAYVVIRQHDLWWDDLLFLVDEVEKNGARAWIWSDYVWHNRDLFLERMPKSVVQSNWYYGAEFDPKHTPVQAYLDLDEHGFEQIPTGSNWSCDTNFEGTVRFAKERLQPGRLLGFLQTVWHPTTENYRQKHFDAVDQLAKAKGKYYSA